MRYDYPPSENEYDEALERLVDGGLSYDSARKKLGPPPYEVYEPTAEEVSSIGSHAVGRLVEAPHRKSALSVPYGAGRIVRLPDGRPLDARSVQDALLSPEQVEINSRGIAAVRRALREK